jgi:hypothetical protein
MRLGIKVPLCADMIVETQIDGHLDLVTATFRKTIGYPLTRPRTADNLFWRHVSPPQPRMRTPAM